MNPLPNHLIYDEYVCTHVLAGDAESAVYKGYHRDDPSVPLAIRCIQFPVKRLSDDTIAECNTHIELASGISAPHTVPILDYGNDEHDYYLVMPYVEGESLYTLVKRTTPKPDGMPSLGEVLSFTETMVEALDAIHNAGLTHGAVAPRNIFIKSTGDLYLSDFGLARLMKIAFQLATTGSFWTGQYTAPEIWDGERNTPSTDQYSLACVMYLLITGSSPFKAKTIFEMMEQHKSKVITPPHHKRPGMPSSLVMFFLTATAKRPMERYRSLQELVSEFAMAIKGKEGEPTGFFSNPK